MNKKIALIAGITAVGLLGGMFFFSNRGNKNGNKGTNDIVTVTHKVGTTEVEEEPKRVVVFDWAILDTLDALGVEGVVGVPQSATIPEYLSQYKSEKYGNVGGLKEPDLEKINELQPDLIIINGRQESFYDKLTEIAPTISMSKEDGKYLESITKNLNIIGDIFNKEKEVEKELVEINNRIDETKKKVEEKGYKATTLMTSKGELSVFGSDSRFGLIYNEAGFKNTDENIQASNHGQNVSFEYVASQDADYMFVLDKSVISSDEKEKTAKELLNNDLINGTKAAKNGNIIYLDTVSWYLADGGVTSTNKMLDEINNAIDK